MKKRILAICLLLAGCCFCICGQSAIVIKAEGKVNLQKFGQKTWSQALVGDQLAVGDCIRAANDGHAVLIFTDDSRIDVFRNSTLTIAERVNRAGAALSLAGLWENVKLKFANAQATSARLGGMGALRGKNLAEPIADRALDAEKREELEHRLTVIQTQKMDPTTTALLRGIVFEKYTQFARAEMEYKLLLSQSPGCAAYVDLLIDMYLKIDFIESAALLLEQKHKSNHR